MSFLVENEVLHGTEISSADAGNERGGLAILWLVCSRQGPLRHLILITWVMV